MDNASSIGKDMCDVQVATPWMAIDHWMSEVNKQANAWLQKTYCIHPNAANEAWYVILSSRTQPTELPSDSVDESMAGHSPGHRFKSLPESLSFSPLSFLSLFFTFLNDLDHHLEHVKN